MNQPVPPSLFGSRAGFEAAFERGLDTLLQAGDLNLFILVLANASFSEALFRRLRPQLLDKFRGLSAGLAEVSSRSAAVDEDFQVFAKIAAIGFHQLSVTRQRRAGPWEVQFNQLRSFRPMRNSQRVIRSIREPFAETGFHFNKPFMQQETIWTGQLLGQAIDLYYNKYPFVDSHALLVPERQSCLPQFLDQSVHTYIWQLTRVLGATIPGLKLGYNAFGAFASVNHLHLQLFVRDRPLPVEASQWQHRGGAIPYPLPCHVFDNPTAAWSMIEQLHERNQAYNLLYTPDRLYCLPRRKQGDFALAEWSSGFSWYEMCGGFITFDQDVCVTLSESLIEAGLAQARLEDGVI